MPTIFRGRRVVTPRAVSYIDDSALVNTNITQPASVVAIVGDATGGQPQVPLHFSDPAEARRVLRSGTLVDCIERAFAPSADGSAGAGEVVALRVNPATQASLVLQDAANPAITLKSRDYGDFTNRIRVSVAAPGSGTGMNLTAALDDVVFSGQNVGYAALGIAYVGTDAPTAVTAAVGYTAGAGTLTMTKTGGTGPGSQALAFANYPTLQSLKDALEATGNYAVTLLYYTSAPTPPTNPAPSTVLDKTTAAVNVLASTGILRADVQAATDWFNNVAGGLLTAVRTVGTGVLAVKPTALLNSGTPGTEGTINTTAWSNCLTALQNEDVHLIVPLSADPSIHALFQAHVALMSDAITGPGKERICILGGAAAEKPSVTPWTPGVTVANPAQRAQSFQDPRMVVVAPGIYDYDRLGNLVLWEPYKVAAQIAGLIAGQGVADAITRRYIRAQGVELVSNVSTAAAGAPLTRSEIETWLLSGVCTIELVPNKGLRVVQGVTSWSADGTFSKKEISVRRAADYIARSVREAADDLLVGQRGSPELLSKAKSMTHSTLTALERDGVIVGNADSPAFRNINCILQGDVLRIDFQASPAVPANFVLITAHLIPFSGTVAG